MILPVPARRVGSNRWPENTVFNQAQCSSTLSRHEEAWLVLMCLLQRTVGQSSNTQPRVAEIYTGRLTLSEAHFSDLLPEMHQYRADSFS